MIQDEKKCVLVTGADGFVGKACCQALGARGFLLREAIWKPCSKTQKHEGSMVVVGNINGCTNWECALNGVEAIIHLAARVHVMRETDSDPLSAFREVNVLGTKQLAESAARAGVKHMIYISTIKIHGERTCSTAFTEVDPANPEDPYAISKWEAEQMLRQVEAKSKLNVTILRPPLIYGPGVKANFIKLIHLIERRIPIPLALVKNKRSFIGLSNFVDILCRCLEHPDAGGKTFVVSDGQDMSTADLIRKIGAAFDTKPLLVPVPPYCLQFIGKLVGKQDVFQRLAESLQIDSTRIRKMLAWQAKWSVEDELQRVADWYHEPRSGDNMT